MLAGDHHPHAALAQFLADVIGGQRSADEIPIKAHGTGRPFCGRLERAEARTAGARTGRPDL